MDRRGVLFATLNVPGGDNNLVRAARNRARATLRLRDWIGEAFRLARVQRQAAVVIVMQANPWAAAGAAPSRLRAAAGHARTQTLDFAGEVLLVHGDTHRYRVDHPLVDPGTRQRIGNFTRLEVFGSPSVNWVRVSVTEERPGSAR